MLDKNGIEIKTGDIVKISGAYFKNDNGLYYVEHSPGDPTWSGRDYSLHKIKRNGELSTAKHNICFWPIGIFVNNSETRALAKDWNKKHAEIEVIFGIDTAHVANYFKTEAANCTEAAKHYSWQWGENNATVKLYRETATYYEKVADRITA